MLFLKFFGVHIHIKYGFLRLVCLVLTSQNKRCSVIYTNSWSRSVAEVQGGSGSIYSPQTQTYPKEEGRANLDKKMNINSITDRSSKSIRIMRTPHNVSPKQVAISSMITRFFLQSSLHKSGIQLEGVDGLSSTLSSQQLYSPYS